jgi:hypothetical protein
MSTMKAGQQHLVCFKCSDKLTSLSRLDNIIDLVVLLSGRCGCYEDGVHDTTLL